MALLKRHSLFFGLLLMYALTWSVYLSNAGVLPFRLPFPLYLLASSGFAVAAIAMTWLTLGPRAVIDLLKRFLLWRVGWGWYASLLIIPATYLSDAATALIIRDRFRLRHTTLSDLQVSSEDGLQSVTITMSAASVDGANVDLPAIMSSVRPLASYANEQQAHVVNCRVQLRDEVGNLLLNYIADFRAGFENWWMADGLSSDWFPQPAPGP